MCDLVNEKLSEVFDVHLALGGIYNSYCTVQYNILFINDILYCPHNIRKLANT